MDQSKKAHCLAGGSVVSRRIADTCSGIAGMDDLSISHINPHMIDIIAACIEQKISRLHLIDRNRLSLASLFSGTSACIDTEMRKYTHDKAGAVCTVCKACTAINIGVSKKLLGIGNYCVAGGRYDLGTVLFSRTVRFFIGRLLRFAIVGAATFC